MCYFCYSSGESRDLIGTESDRTFFLRGTPGLRGKMLIGYCLVETEGAHATGGASNTAHQLSGDSSQQDGSQAVSPDAVSLRELGCEQVFSDMDDDRRADRPGLRAALDFARLGDVLVVPSLKHVGADVDAVVRLIADLSQKGVTIRLGGMPMDMMIPSGEALAFACRALVQLAEPGPMPVNGADPPRRRGRPQSLSAKDIAKARQLLANGSAVPEVARALGVSPATVYRIFPRRTQKSPHPGDPAS